MSQTATFVFSDLAGFTALTEAHGDDGAADAAIEFFSAVRSIVSDYEAEEVKTIGDAVLLRVPPADQAVHLAARLVGDFGARHRALGIRVGMHTGTAVRRGGDWFGTAVNIAARVGDLAAAGEVLMTGDTCLAVSAELLPGQLEPRGRFELKNVRDPVEIVALAFERSPSGERLTVDPVCRMAVDPTRTHQTAIHADRTYYFCSSGWRGGIPGATGALRRRGLLNRLSRRSGRRRACRASSHCKKECSSGVRRSSLVLLLARCGFVLPCSSCFSLASRWPCPPRAGL